MDGYYSVSDFNKIYFENSDGFELDEDIKQMFQYLTKNITVLSMDDAVSSNCSKKNNSNVDRGFKRSSMQKRLSNNAKSETSIEWETARTPAFKITKLEIKEGVEKKINDVRGLLNKLSTKNYETQRGVILDNISMLFLEAELSDEDKTKLVLSVLEIARSNKFYSELYADLCKELSDAFPLFGELLPKVLIIYTETLNDINYIDHNVDYDGFCNYTKSNDLRKSCAVFIVNLMKRGVLEKSQIINIIVDLIGFVRRYIDEDNRSNEVDEITENLYLFITQSKTVLVDQSAWKTVILPFIQHASKMKSKDHKSLSSRAVFKYMDILDDLSKK
jgi:hypothetical protein